MNAGIPHPVGAAPGRPGHRARRGAAGHPRHPALGPVPGPGHLRLRGPGPEPPLPDEPRLRTRRRGRPSPGPACLRPTTLASTASCSAVVAARRDRGRGHSGSPGSAGCCGPWPTRPPPWRASASTPPSPGCWSSACRPSWPPWPEACSAPQSSRSTPTSFNFFNSLVWLTVLVLAGAPPWRARSWPPCCSSPCRPSSPPRRFVEYQPVFFGFGGHAAGPGAQRAGRPGAVARLLGPGRAQPGPDRPAPGPERLQPLPAVRRGRAMGGR